MGPLKLSNDPFENVNTFKWIVSSGYHENMTSRIVHASVKHLEMTNRQKFPGINVTGDIFI